MTRRKLILALAAFMTGLGKTAVAKSRYHLRILSFRCVGCKDCYRVCPKPDAVIMRRGKAVINQEECNACMKCESVCTYGAIERCEEYRR